MEPTPSLSDDEIANASTRRETSPFSARRQSVPAAHAHNSNSAVEALVPPPTPRIGTGSSRFGGEPMVRSGNNRRSLSMNDKRPGTLLKQALAEPRAARIADCSFSALLRGNTEGKPDYSHLFTAQDQPLALQSAPHGSSSSAIREDSEDEDDDPAGLWDRPTVTRQRKKHRVVKIPFCMPSKLISALRWTCPATKARATTSEYPRRCPRPSTRSPHYCDSHRRQVQSP